MSGTYYEILGVPRDASLPEIKRAFRRKAKEVHPDLHEHASEQDLARMRELLLAYQTLSDPRKREDYDQCILTCHPREKRYRFDYREFLRERVDDLHSQAKLVFFDLLHDREEEAISLYERLRQKGDFRLEEYLDREDAMDCLFLVAEAYEKRGELEEAVVHLLTVSSMEKEKPYFRHFFEEVLTKLRRFLGWATGSEIEMERRMRYIVELIGLGVLGPRDEAYFYKRLSELSLRRGDRTQARFYLQRALVRNGGRADASRLYQKMLQEEIV